MIELSNNHYARSSVWYGKLDKSMTKRTPSNWTIEPRNETLEILRTINKQVPLKTTAEYT